MDGIAEILMDENAMQKAPRPGTSLQRPPTSASGGSGGGLNAGIRPMSSSGRPLSGFARPGTQQRLGTASRGGGLEGAFSGGRPGTSRPMSVAGRYVRIGTQSMLTMSGENGQFINSERLDIAKYSQRPAESKAIMDYLLYVEKNAKKALELAAECTKFAEFKDWWWKSRLGKCYYLLGLYREAQKQYLSALKQQEMILTYLELSKVYLKLDQPNTALDNYMTAAEKFPGDTSLIVGIARVYDALNDIPRSIQYYKKVLHYDASNAEAIACLASHHFYNDQPEIALRFYRRLLQMGVSNTELWNNIGLSCFYASQYDMTLSCFERALSLAEDDVQQADVWYNIGQVAIGIGDLNLAYQAFKITVAVQPLHAEAFNNLGILELRKGNVEQARSNFQTGYKLAPHLFEPFFNAALVAFKLGDCQEAFDMVTKSLDAYNDHTDSKELLKQLKKHFTML